MSVSKTSKLLTARGMGVAGSGARSVCSVAHRGWPRHRPIAERDCTRAAREVAAEKSAKESGRYQGKQGGRPLDDIAAGRVQHQLPLRIDRGRLDADVVQRNLGDIGARGRLAIAVRPGLYFASPVNIRSLILSSSFEVIKTF